MNALWAALIGAAVGGLLAIAGGVLAQIWRDTQESRAAARAIAAELWIHWSAWADWDSETSKAVPFDHHSVPDWYEEVP